MMLVAFIMRPWIIEMRGLHAKGRVLADEILVTSTGPDHEQVFRKAFEATHRYLHRMGARLAPKKSFIFSTEKAVRSALARHRWSELDTRIEVVQHTRDLGSHVNTLLCNRSTTLTGRMANGIIMARRIARLPMGDNEKAKVIRTKASPGSQHATSEAAYHQ